MEKDIPANIRVHRPVLTEEERARRMKRIKEAAEQLLIATAEAKRNKRREGENAGAN